MSKTPSEKRIIWAQRTAEALGISVDAAQKLLRTERMQSIRINPLQGDPAASEAELGHFAKSQHEPYDWMPQGYAVPPESLSAIRDSQLVTDGRVFIQNAASWLPVLALDAQPGESVLDVCAAPGGKASHIAANTNNQALLTVNDNSRPRLAKMRANFERLGVQPVTMTLFDATQLARKLDGQLFDKILLDAPCSGEGMMRYDRDKDFVMWSVAQIKRLQQLQKRLITQAWQLVKPGGTLVYSTCTMAPEENEAVIDYLLRTRPDALVVPFTIDLPNRIDTVREWNGKQFSLKVQGAVRLQPSPHIEAFFVCKITKLDSGSSPE
ncbi:MAG TPA: RsmB/NOP family class I SAM-dependent RNA methyltransferase [Candidatus Saccharimonadales bacterium]|nr:RsmB/NOP family class I SAM-dependent RNA methyltransferase [Candidatus Saccharimonadales bacterium]